MNERIKELAINCAGQLEWDSPKDPESFTFSCHELERFAMLLLQECIDKIETYRIPVGNSVAGEMACRWTYDALKEIRDEIKEHFGIEE